MCRATNTLVLSICCDSLHYPPPQEKWLGGYKDKLGRDVDTFEMLQILLTPHFDLVEERVLQCVCREAPRLFFWFLDHATVWRKRETATS